MSAERWIRGAGLVAAGAASVLLGAVVVLFGKSDPVPPRSQPASEVSEEPAALWESPTPRTPVAAPTATVAPEDPLLHQSAEAHHESANHRFLVRYARLIHPVEPARQWAPAAVTLGRTECSRLAHESVADAVIEFRRLYTVTSTQAKGIIDAAIDSFCPQEREAK